MWMVQFLLAEMSTGTVNATLQNPGTAFNLDGDFDNGIIAHEYGHGISNRLTGGASNSSCLSNDEQMGEGWSDWFGLMLTIEPADTDTDIRGIGTYASGEAPSGYGIRLPLTQQILLSTIIHMMQPTIRVRYPNHMELALYGVQCFGT